MDDRLRPVFNKIATIIAVILFLAGCAPQGAPGPQTPIPATPRPSTSTAITQPTQTPPQPPPATTKPPLSSPSNSPATIAGTLTVHFIDVGQGDSILIQAPDGKNMLIDGGEVDSGALQYLKSKSISRLDLMVATHPHADHIGGLVQVLRAMPVAKVVTNGQPTTTRTYENFLDAIMAAKAEYYEVKRGDTLRLGDLVFAVLNPVSNKGDDLNDGSIVLRVAHGKTSFLFAGDAQARAEASMSVSSFSPVQATILKVAHHGSRSSSSREFLSLVKPEVAIYSAGKGNSYGHPHAETIANLSSVGAQIYGTDVNGTVVVTTDGNGHKVIPTYGQGRGPPNTATSGAPPSPTSGSPSATTVVPQSAPAAVPLAPPTTPSAPPAVIPQPTPTQPAVSSLILDIVSVTSPIKPGANATLVARTSPGASCSITVYYKAGPSTAQGLDTKVADATGSVSWIWMVGTRTTPGNWRIVVKASKDGQSITRETTFTVS